MILTGPCHRLSRTSGFVKYQKQIMERVMYLILGSSNGPLLVLLNSNECATGVMEILHLFHKKGLAQSNTQKN